MVNLFPGGPLPLIVAGKPFEKASGIVYSQIPLLSPAPSPESMAAGVV
jgi:hypothetical protein